MSTPQLAYAPGPGWLLLATGDRLLLLDPRYGAAHLTELWGAVSSGGALAGLLDRLLAGGVTTAPTFALLEWQPGERAGALDVTVLVRGPLTLTFERPDGAVELTGEDASTWVERRMSDVDGVRVGEVDLEGALPVVVGVVQAAGCALGDLDRAVEPAEPAVLEMPARPEVPEVSGEPMTAEPAAVAPSGQTAVFAPDAEGDHLFDATVYQPVGQGRSQRTDAAPDPVAPDVAPTPAVPVPAAPPVSVPSPPRAGDHDGHTIMVSDIAELRAARVIPPPPPAARPAGPRLFLESSDGVREWLDEPLLLGRAPSATRVPGSAVPRLVTVVTPNQELSRTHVEVRAEGGVVVITDLHSKNGTTVALPGRAPQRLREGEPTPVLVGSVIDLGDGAVYTVGEA